MHRNRAIAPLLAATVAALLCACASVRERLPFGNHPEPAPQPVRELSVQVAENAAMPVVLQFWERNTLVVDLQGVPSSGSLRLAPEPGHAWPAQMAFRMSPARFQQLDVRGEQRVQLSVTPGAEPTTAQLPPGVYSTSTAGLDLRWGATGEF